MDRTHVINLVSQFLEADEFNHAVDGDTGVIRLGFQGGYGLFEVRLVLRGEPPCLGIVVYLPLVVPREQRAAMSEALVRANYGLLMGSFDLDYADGRIYFRNTLPLGDNPSVTHRQFRQVLMSALGTVDHYYRALNRLVFGDDLSPAEVIAEVELADADPSDASEH